MGPQNKDLNKISSLLMKDLRGGAKFSICGLLISAEEV